MTLDPDPLHVPETDDDAPAVIAWGCLAAVAWAVIVGVLLLIAFRQPVVGSVTESRLASVAVSPSEGASWSAPATRIGPSDSVSTGGPSRWSAPATTSGEASGAKAEVGTVLIEGKASWMPAKYGAGYLAMRIPRGTRVTLCGDGGCWTTRVNDYGPSKRIHPDRIADIAVGQWERICGLPRDRGLCRITAEYGGRPLSRDKPTPTGPPTDTLP